MMFSGRFRHSFRTKTTIFEVGTKNLQAMPIKKIMLLAILGSSLLSCRPDVQNPFQSGFHAGLAQGYENGVLPGLHSVVQWDNFECNSLFF